MKFFLIFTILALPCLGKVEEWKSVDLSSPFKHRFIVQNLASLTVRAYQRNCEFTESCSNVLIFQAPIVIGKDEEESRSRLGFFKISRWTKFHKDYEGQYLAWNESPKPPNSSRSEWNKTGPFGWYTAFLEPNAGDQWIHGTIGWGSDGERFIEHSKSSSGNFDRVRSKGCTRVSNQSISFLRKFIPEGSFVLKIYALEDFEDLKLINYTNTPYYNNWSYTLSTRRIDSGESLLENLTEPYFEQGILIYSQYPVKIDVKPKGEAISKRKNYNPYELSKNEFKGKFLVDSGLLINYSHPSKLATNGVKIPPYFKYEFINDLIAFNPRDL